MMKSNLFVPLENFVHPGGHGVGSGKHRDQDVVPEELETAFYANPDSVEALDKICTALSYTTVTAAGRVEEHEPNAEDLRDFLLAAPNDLVDDSGGAANTHANQEDDLPDGAPLTILPNHQIDDLPFRAVGRIHPIGCTGTLIGPRHVLTAAHCVYSLKEDGYYNRENMRFQLGLHGSAFPGQSYKVLNTIVPKSYRNAGAGEWMPYDYGIIILEDPVDASVGRMHYGVSDNVAFSSAKVHFNGYPADGGFPGNRVYHGHAFAQPSGTRLLHYPIDTVGGVSGSAVYMLNTTYGSVIYGIHSGSYTYNDQFNRGVRITKAVYYRIRGWKELYS